MNQRMLGKRCDVKSRFQVNSELPIPYSHKTLELKCPKPPKALSTSYKGNSY